MNEQRINIKYIKAARKYAEALFDVAVERDNTDKVYDNLVLTEQTAKENKDLTKFLMSPVITVKDKRETVKAIFENHVTQEVMNFLYLLCDNSKFEMLPEITDQYRKLKDDKYGILQVRVTSAVEIKDCLKENLSKAIEKKYGKSAEITYGIDSAIIGGLIIETDGETIDSSTAGQLKKLKKQLI